VVSPRRAHYHFGMFQRIAQDPAIGFRLGVYLFAAVVFPLHLGWVGVSWGQLWAYLAIAAVLLSLPVALLVRPLHHAKWQAMVIVAISNAVLSAVPAMLAFSVGSALGPIDEAIDEKVCAAQGLGEQDSALAEANDTVDVLPDCQ